MSIYIFTVPERIRKYLTTFVRANTDRQAFFISKWLPAVIFILLAVFQAGYAHAEPVPPVNPVLNTAFLSSAAASWTAVGSDGGYVVEASTKSDFVPLWASSSTLDGAATALAVLSPALDPNTTYFFRVGALWGGTPYYADTNPPSSSTLSNQVAGTQVYGVWTTSITVNWLPLSAAPSSSTAEGYILEASTEPGFVPVWNSSSTPDVALSTLTIANLAGGKTYYFRAGSLNWRNAPNYAASVSTGLDAEYCVYIDTDDIGLGNIAVNTEVVIATKTVVANCGNVPVTFEFKASTITAGSPWRISDAQGIDRFILWAGINSSQPLSTAFGDEDRLGDISVKADATKFAAGQTGTAVPSGEARYTWFKLLTPLVSNTDREQKLNVTVTATAP